ncbi:MAG: NAD(P)-dependent oxidoreductase [Rhodobacteraceae bacterium]|nr:MAG: NAD(P)-dependent oxidoreductase [Paracoccaceae bacterium]
MLTLKDKTIFVSGAGAGMGRAVSLLAAQAGATVIATDINKDKLNELSKKNIITFTLDVANKDHVTDFFDNNSAFDGIVNMAGWVHHGQIVDTNEEDWRKSFQINVDSMYYVIRAALPKILLNGKGASIVNMASLASSLKGFKFRAAYSASKGAVIGLTKSIAIDYVERGIRCNAICPGTIETPSLSDRIKALSEKLGSEEKARDWFTKRQPMRRLGQPNEIAQLIIYLLSDDGAYATGQCHVIDGGTMI